MNEQLAKKFRKLAKDIARTRNLPAQLLVQHKETGVIINHPKSERGIYRKLKRDYARRHYGNYAGRTASAPSG